MLQSAAWRSLTLNARRFIDFLLIEHMRHAGTANGDLFATYDQLNKFGINKKQIRDAIARAERVGLVDTRKGARRMATRYTLTWLPVSNAPPTDRWKFYRGRPVIRLTPVAEKNSAAPETGGRSLPETGGEKGQNAGFYPPKRGVDPTPRDVLPVFSASRSVSFRARLLT
jgi:hypothetical protein